EPSEANGILRGRLLLERLSPVAEKVPRDLLPHLGELVGPAGLVPGKLPLPVRLGGTPLRLYLLPLAPHPLLYGVLLAEPCQPRRPALPVVGRCQQQGRHTKGDAGNQQRGSGHRSEGTVPPQPATAPRRPGLRVGLHRLVGQPLPDVGRQLLRRGIPLLGSL